MTDQIMQIGGPYDGASIKADHPVLDHVAFINDPKCLYLLKTFRHTPHRDGKAETKQFYVLQELDPDAALAKAIQHWDRGYQAPEAD